MSFQPPSKSFTTRDYLFIAVILAAVLAVSVGLVNLNLSLPAGGGEFLRHWVGARSYLFDRIDPYTTNIPETVQRLVYGNSASAGDEPYILDTPFHLLLLYFPFALLSDPMLARAIYTMILEWALIALALLSLRLIEWNVPRWFYVLFLPFCVFNFYSFQALTDATPVLLLGLIYAGILLALQNEADELAGALAVASTYYWEAGLPFLLLMAWYCYRTNRVRVLAGFFMFAFILLVVSFLLYPGWIIPALRAGMNNFRAEYGYSLFSVFHQFLPSIGNFFAWAVIVAFIVILGYEWNASLRADSRRLYWAACLTLASTPLLGFRSGIENLALLILPLALIFAVAHDRWKRIGSLLIALLLVLLFAVPWAVYLSLPAQYQALTGEILFLFLPVFTVIGLYWIRWWAIRPPRVWADSL